MGCCESTQTYPKPLSRIIIPAEEKAIKILEQEYVFTLKSAREIKKALKANSVDRKLSV